MSAIGHNGGPDRWIKLWESTFDHWLVGRRNPEYFTAWQDLLMMCRYADGHIMVAGRKMMLKRGSLLGAVSFLAARWRWTPKKVRVFLDKLESDGMIKLTSPCSNEGRSKGRLPNVISACNYEKYQNPDAELGPVTGQVKGELGAGSGQVKGEKYKKGKKDKKDKNQQQQLYAGRNSKELHDELVECCNGALDNPANRMGLLMVAEPIQWLEEGCDLEKDIKPTLRAVGQRDHGKRIGSWNYFTGMVKDAKRRRDKGLDTFNEHGERETSEDRLRKVVAEEAGK